MDKNKKEQAEKLHIKLDKLLQTRDKKQKAFDKAKKELAELSKSIESTKLKLFEILQSGSDDTAFSNWAKKKIGENGNHGNDKTENSRTANHQNGNSENHANVNSVNPQKPTSQNQSSQPSQNHQQGKGQNHNQPQQQNQNQRQ